MKRMRKRFSSLLSQSKPEKKVLGEVKLYLNNLFLSRLLKRKKKEKKKIGYVWLRFFKTIFCSEKQGEQVKHKEHIWFLFFCSKKHSEHRKH